MRRAKLHISAFLMAFFMAALVSFSAMMCLVEAFSLTCEMPHLLAVCAAAALAAACGMLPGRTGLMTLAGLAVYLALAILLRQPLTQSLQAVLFGITTEYANCFAGVGVVGQAGDSLLFLSAVVVPFCWITAWTVCREGNALFLLLACLPVLLLCLVIVDIAPVFWLVLLTCALLLLLLSHSVRERSANEGSRLAWWMILPVTILVAAITIVWPPADYVRADWSQQMQAMAESGLRIETLQELPKAISSSLPRWSRELREVDLSRIGPKSMTGREVLRSQCVEARYYLRGSSLGVYEENAWHAVDQDRYAAESFSGQPLLSVGGSGSSMSLQIETLRTEDLLYTTYVLASVPETAAFVDDAYINNQDDLREYQIDYYRSGDGTGSVPAGYDDYVNLNYTQIPEELRAALQVFLAEQGWASADPETLAALVRNSAVYDLNTPRIPAGEDFVLYFLQQSKRGYCVHFASATVMLLRTMGVPARYVTGYSVSGTAGEWITVTEDDAHAWVEYYVNGIGWLPLEPTPAVDETQYSTETDSTPVPSQEEQVQYTEETEPDSPQVEQSKPTEGLHAAADEQKAGDAATFWYWLLVLPGLVALILLRRWLIMRRRKHRCTHGHPNRRAMALWRWLIRLARREGTSVEEDLICLAEKARFSQHTLNEEELARLQEALEQRISRLRQHSAGMQLWYRYGLILY